MAGVDASINLTLVDRVSAGIQRIQARFAALSTRLKLDKLGASFSNLGKRFGDLTSGIASSATRATTALGLFGASFAGVFYGAFSLVKETADAGAAIAEISTKLGIGAVAWQQYAHAASMAGIESSTVETAIQKLGVNAVGALKGSKELSKAFGQLGVRLTDSKGKMLPMEQILDRTIYRLAEMEDPVKRNALAVKLLGKSGAELSKMMGDGAEGIRKARGEAIVMSDAAAAAGDEFGDNLDLLTNRLKSFGTMMGIHLLPTMNDLVVSVKEWLDANNGLVKSKIAEWAEAFSNAIRSLMDPTSQIRVNITRFFDAIESGYSVIKPIVDYIGGPMVAALTALGIWIAGPAVLGIGMFTAALVQATAATISFGASLLMNPIGLVVVAIVAGVAAIGAAVYVLIQRWDEFKAYFTEGWDSVVSAFDQGFIQGIYTLLTTFNPWKLLAKGISEVIEYFTGIDLYDAGARVMESLWDGLKSVWADIAAWFKDSLNSMIGWLPESLQKSLGFDPEATKAASAASAVTQTATRVSNSVSAPVTTTANIASSIPEQQTAQASVNDQQSVVRPAYQSLSEMPQRLSAAVSPSLVASQSTTERGTAMNDTLSRIKNISADSILVTRIRETGENSATKTERNTSAVQNYEPLRQEVNYTIDNSLKVGAVNVNVSGMTEQDGRNMVRSAINDLQKQQAANLRASLSD